RRSESGVRGDHDREQVLEHLADVFERLDAIAHAFDQIGRAGYRRGRSGTERVAVGGCGGEGIETQRSPGAVAVDPDYGLAEMRRRCGSGGGVDDVNPAARGIGDDNFDLPGGPSLSTRIESLQQDRENEANSGFAFHGVMLMGRRSRRGSFAQAGFTTGIYSFAADARQLKPPLPRTARGGPPSPFGATPRARPDSQGHTPIPPP